MSTPLLKLPNTLKASAAAVLGAVLFGAEIGYWSQTSNFVSFNRVMTGDMDVEISANELTLLTCTLYIVGFLFALPPVTRIFAGGLGRRMTLIISGFLFAVAMAMQASAAHISYPASKALLWSGRALLGVPVAFSVTTSPMFLSEISPYEHRGLIGGLFQFSLMVFLVVASGIGMAINSSFPDSDNAYQYSVWWMVPLGLLVSGAMYFSNETPQFLLLNGKDDEAEAVLYHLRKGADEKATRREFKLMKDDILAQKSLGDVTLKGLFSGFTLRIIIIVCVTQFLQQFSGMNVLNNFSPKLYSSLVSNPDMMGFIGNVIQLIATIPSALLVDRLGRRPLLMFGAAFLALAWTVIGILGVVSFNHPEHCYKILDCPEGGDYYCDSDALFTTQEMAIENVCGVASSGSSSNYTACSDELNLTPSDSFNLDCLYTGDGAPTAAHPHPFVSPIVGYVFIAMTYTVSFVFGLTLGPVIWSYNAEIAPAAVRAQIVGLSAASNLFFNAVVVSPMIGELINSLGFNSFWVFVVIMSIAFVVFYWLVETKDLPVEIVTEKWEEKLNCKYTNLHHSTNGCATTGMNDDDSTTNNNDNEDEDDENDLA
jgi:MFS family permease